MAMWPCRTRVYARFSFSDGSPKCSVRVVLRQAYQQQVRLPLWVNVLCRAVQELSSTVAEVNLSFVDDGALLLVWSVMDNGCIGASRRDRLERQPLEQIELTAVF